MHKALVNLSKQLEIHTVGQTYDQMCYYLTDKDKKDGKRLYVLEGKEDRVELVNIYDGTVTVCTNYCTFHRNINDSNHTTTMILDSIFMCFVCGITEKGGKTTFHYYADNLKPVNSIFTLDDFELHMVGNTAELYLPTVSTPFIGTIKKVPQGIGKSPDISWVKKNNDAKNSTHIRDEWFD